MVSPVTAAQISFTQEEKDYLAKTRTLRAASIDGGAPLHYIDSKGEAKGIAVSVLDEISNLTDLTFDCHLHKSMEEVIESRPDVYLGVTKEYAPPNVILSVPYLESEAILFYRKSVDPKQLDDKTYAAIKGGTLPQGVKEERTIYFDNRADTIDAVESGKADYGFGNAYSMAYYSLQNDYKNVITIPTGKEDRSYCLGVSENNEILLSILDKSIEAICKTRMDTLILNVASQIERKLSFSMIIDTYGQHIFVFCLLIIGLLSYGVFLNNRAKRQLGIENDKHRLLSKLSNEYLFEYQIKSGNVVFSDRLSEYIESFGRKTDLTQLLETAIANDVDENSVIKLPLRDGNAGVFKMVSSYLKDEKGEAHFVIGKLIDVSKEVEEKNRLILESKLDGLTGIYNAAATRAAITECMKNKVIDQIDALTIIDCDEFKQINDTYGHLTGNVALVEVAEALKSTFSDDDIVGRIGGDEFCVYTCDVQSADFVTQKCEQVIGRLRQLEIGLSLTISIGIAVWKDKMTYEELFRAAEIAMYRSKQAKDSKISMNPSV